MFQQEILTPKRVEETKRRGVSFDEILDVGYSDKTIRPVFNVFSKKPVNKEKNYM